MLETYFLITLDGCKKVIAVIYLLLLDIQSGDLRFRIVFGKVIDILAKAGTRICNFFGSESLSV